MFAGICMMSAGLIADMHSHPRTWGSRLGQVSFLVGVLTLSVAVVLS